MAPWTSSHAGWRASWMLVVLGLLTLVACPVSAQVDDDGAAIAEARAALASPDADAREAAITRLQHLPASALPAIAARLEQARRGRPTLEEANTALTAFRRATGSRRADDLVDIAAGVSAVLAADRSRPTVAMAEALLLLRSLEALRSDEACLLIPRVFLLDGVAWRMESRRVTLRLMDRVAAAALRTRAQDDNAEGRAWARFTTEHLGLDAPGTLVQRLGQSDLASVLRAYGETHTLSAIPVVASFVDSDARQVRTAARDALRAYRQNGIWVARETFRTRLGDEADANWGWERTLNALYDGLDARRAEQVRTALAQASAVLDAGQLNDAEAALDAALLDGPELADLEAARLYARMADAHADRDRNRARMLFQRALVIAPQAPEADRWTAEVRHLDALAMLATGVLDAEAFRRAAEVPACTRCVATFSRFAPQLEVPERGNRALRFAASGLLLLLLGILLLPVWRTSSRARGHHEAAPPDAEDELEGGPELEDEGELGAELQLHAGDTLS